MFQLLLPLKHIVKGRSAVNCWVLMLLWLWLWLWWDTRKYFIICKLWLRMLLAHSSSSNIINYQLKLYLKPTKDTALPIHVLVTHMSDDFLLEPNWSHQLDNFWQEQDNTDKFCNLLETRWLLLHLTRVLLRVLLSNLVWSFKTFIEIQRKCLMILQNFDINLGDNDL